METTQKCVRCETEKPQQDWHPSRWGLSGQWCKECYRTWHRARYTPKNEADDSPRNCVWCGESYRPKQRRASIYCSRQCKDRAKTARWAEKNQAKKPAIRQCPHCGSDIPQTARADAVFCSALCNDRAHRLQRKLRARGGYKDEIGYIRAYICERDGWRCQICGGKVSPGREHPDPLCASLDHLIPVAEGGDSSIANLRLTHLRCNLSRRHRGGNEQLPLIG